jgi:amino acid transporter
MAKRFFGYVAIATGMAMAASSFSMLAAMFGVVGARGVVAAILVGGALTVVVAAAIGGLASLYPSAPGLATYLKKAFGSRLAMTASILYLSLVVCIIGAEGAALAEVVRPFVPAAVPVAAGPCVLVAVIACNMLGLELPWRVQMSATVALIVVAMTISVIALLRPAPEMLTAVPEPGSGHAWSGPFAEGIGMSVFLFLGFEWVAPLGRSPDDYRRLLPLSMIVAVVALVVLYSTFALALARNFPSERVAGTLVPAYLVASRTSGRSAGVLAMLLCLLANVTVYNGSIMGASRLIFALARQGSLPRSWGRVSVQTGTPVVAIAIIGSVSTLGSLALNLTRTASIAAAYAAAVECTMYGALVFAWLRLRGSRVPETGFHPPFPRALLIAVACMMPLVGLAALGGDARHAWSPAVVFVVAVLGAVALTRGLGVADGARPLATRLAPTSKEAQ